jgi:hypothetical protein
VGKVVFSEGFKVACRLSSIIVGLVFYTIIMCLAVEVVGVEGVACVRSEDCKRRDALVVSLIGGAVGAQCSCGAHCLIMVGVAFIVSASAGPLQHNKRKFADIQGNCHGMTEAMVRMQSTFLVS